MKICEYCDRNLIPADTSYANRGGCLPKKLVSRNLNQNIVFKNTSNEYNYSFIPQIRPMYIEQVRILY